MRDCTFLKNCPSYECKGNEFSEVVSRFQIVSNHTHVQYLQLISDLMVIKGLCCGREKPVCVSLSACGQVVTHSLYQSL